MIILAILASLAAIGLLCWLLFTLAVFALPAFVGFAAGTWALIGTGAAAAVAVPVVASQKSSSENAVSPAGERIRR